MQAKYDPQLTKIFQRMNRNPTHTQSAILRGSVEVINDILLYYENLWPYFYR